MLQPSNILATKRSFLWIGAIIVCIVLIAVTMISRKVMAGNGMQQQTGNVNNVLAVITNSGSTNAPGSTLTIYQDGSGSLVYQKGSNSARFSTFHDRTFPSGTFDSHQLTSLLNEIKDVSAIPNHGCMKSVSFGSTTTITAQGKTSGDLSCLSSQDSSTFLDLKHLVETMYTHISNSPSDGMLS